MYIEKWIYFEKNPIMLIKARYGCLKVYIRMLSI